MADLHPFSSAAPFSGTSPLAGPRPAETPSGESAPGSFAPRAASDGGEPEAVLAAAKRRRSRPEAAAPGAALRADSSLPREASVPREAGTSPRNAADGDAARPRRRRARSKSSSVLALDDHGSAAPARAATYDSGHFLAQRGRRAWGVAAVVVGIALAVLTGLALDRIPEPPPISGFDVRWQPGPRLRDQDVLAMIHTFPARDQLAAANAWVLDRLAQHLRAQPAIARVGDIAVVVDAEPGASPARARRRIAIDLTLREGVLPLRLSDGRRASIDAEGVILPPGIGTPIGPLPELLHHDALGRPGLLAAIDLWQRLCDRLPQGTLTAIDLDAPLDNGGSAQPAQRGLVLTTRSGGRIIWGRPDDARYAGPGGALDAAAKADALVEALRGNPSLATHATLNLRFSRPFYALRTPGTP